MIAFRLSIAAIGLALAGLLALAMQAVPQCSDHAPIIFAGVRP